MHITKGRADWIDVLSPTRDDLDWLKKRFGFHDVVISELSAPSDHPKLDAYDNYLFLVHHFPIYDGLGFAPRRAEVDFIITKHQIITVHYERIEPMLNINSERAQNSFELAYYMLGTLLDFELRQLQDVKNRVEHIGTKLLQNLEHEILESVTALKRHISEYHSIVRHHEPVFNSLLVRGMDLWGPSAQSHLHELVRTGGEIANRIENCREALNDLERANNQIIGLNARRTAKTFITLALFTSPFLFSASIFGLLLGSDPVMDILWYIVGAVALSLFFSAVYLMRKKRL